MSALAGTHPVNRAALASTVTLCLLLACFATANDVLAGAPEYHKFGLKVGTAIEASGRLDRGGSFVVSDLQLLPKPRRPKLRAEVTAFDDARGTMVVLGRTIALGDDTEFEGGTRGDLRTGRRLEVSCAVGAGDTWRARTITFGQIKATDKIKGTITAMQYDGTAPDTLSISGLVVILDDRTDLEEASVLRGKRDKALFAKLAQSDATGLSGVHVYGDGAQALAVQFRQNSVAIRDHDLTDRYDSDLDTTQPELRLRWSGFWHPALRTHVEARVRRLYVLDSDLGAGDGDAEFQLIQAWALWRADDHLALAVGRQDFDEEREWLYDEYLDAARVVWLPADRWSVQASLIHAVEPLKDKSATWTDALVVADHWLDKRSRVSAWLLARRDSDEARNREPVWTGLRYFGEPRRGLTAWGELARMTGEDKRKPLEAWALDLGGTLRLAGTPGSPALTAGFALGSGDESGADGTDATFRQTGYQDNSARLGGLASTYYYGALLDAELSNLRVLTLGAAVRPLPDASVEVLWHRYHQHRPDDDLKGNLIDPPARPNGVSDDLGWGLDFVVAAPRLWGAIRASWTTGIFEPGEAFAPRRDLAVMHRLNITVEL